MIEFLTESQYVKFIKNCEKLCRGSLEYKDWVHNCRELGGYKCAVTNVTLEEASIEIHHTPFTLYDLVAIIMFNIDFSSTFQVCDKVMNIHKENLVGWSPLSKTTHELVHSGAIDLDEKLINGNYHKIFDLYKIPEEVLDRVSPRLNHKN